MNLSKDLDTNLQLIIREIDNAENIIITTHINPDGDAIGSALGAYFFLNQIGKNAKIILPNEIPFYLTFLKGTESVSIYSDNLEAEVINADLILVLDLNSVKRLKDLGEAIQRSNARKAIIDHHLDPEDFADIYAIDTDASSTGEMIWKLIKNSADKSITKEVAISIYTAIMTDSGSFRFPRTDALVHKIVAELLESGADPVEIYEAIYNQSNPSAMKLHGRAYSGIELLHGGKFNLMVLTENDFSESDATTDDIEGLVEKTLSIKGVRAGALLMDVPGENTVKVSLRSKGNVNVRKIAFELGGGGHLNAAGARIHGSSISEIKPKLINLMEDALKDESN